LKTDIHQLSTLSPVSTHYRQNRVRDVRDFGTKVEHVQLVRLSRKRGDGRLFAEHTFDKVERVFTVDKVERVEFDFDASVYWVLEKMTGRILVK